MLEISQDLVDAGRIAANTHQEVARLVTPGVNLLTIESRVKELIALSGAKSAFLGYKGYPATSCLSVNSAVVHAIPQNYVLKSGDVLSVDLGVEKNGWIVDTAWSYAVGKVAPRVAELLLVTKKSLDEAIKVYWRGDVTYSHKSGPSYSFLNIADYGVGIRFEPFRNRTQPAELLHKFNMFAEVLGVSYLKEQPATAGNVVSSDVRFGVDLSYGR